MHESSRVAATAPWTVFLAATCLRPAITVVGPLLPTIGDATQLSEARLGVLGALPLIAFAVVSPLVHRLSRALGGELGVAMMPRLLDHLSLAVLAPGCAVVLLLAARLPVAARP